MRGLLFAAKMLTQEHGFGVWQGRLFCKASARLALVLTGLVLLQFTGVAAAADDGWFFLRNHNPFLQIYGLPPFQTASLATAGEVQYRATLDIANHADSGNSTEGTVLIDGESYFLTLSARYGLKRWLEVGFDLPIVWHSNGIFDNGIERWHKIWGLSNAERSRPSNQLLFRYERQEGAGYELSSPVSGIGDLQIAAAVPLFAGDGYAIALRSSLKLPTGDEQELLGSGASDVSLGLYGSKSGIFGWQDLGISGFAGILRLGEGEIFREIQERSVAFGGLAAAWQLTERLSLAAQVYAQDSYLKSDLKDIGGSSVQASFGGTYRIPKHRFSLSFALVEDLVTDTVSDVALHVSLRWYGDKQ